MLGNDKYILQIKEVAKYDIKNAVKWFGDIDKI